MRLTVLLISASVSLGAQIAHAQAQQEWVARFTSPGAADDRAGSVVVDASGNVYATGQTAGNGTGLDYVTVKYGASGVQQWMRTYNGPGKADDVAHAVAVDGSGNVYVTGYSVGAGAADEDFATIKYTAAGDLEWVARYNGPASSWDEALDIAVDESGYVCVTGRSSHMGSWFDFDYATIKYDPAGAQQWAARYNGAGNDWDQANSVAVDRLGNVYVTGTVARDTGTAFHDYGTIKYTPAGAMDWITFFDGSAHNWDEAVSIAVDDDGNAYLTGFTTGVGTIYDFVTVKYTTAGSEAWSRTWTGAGATADVAKALAIDSAGNVFVTGSSALNYATVKYSNAGVQQWAMLYGGGADDIPYAIAPDLAGNVYVTGASANNIATIKYDDDGSQEWVAQYNGPGSGQDEAFALAVDAASNVYVAGYSRGLGTGPDFTTIKYSQPTSGIHLVSSELTPGFRLSQNQPNPSSGITTIEFELAGAADGGVALRVYDPSGRRLETLIDGRLAPGTYTVDWDGSRYAAGTYFYTLTAGQATGTKKLVLTK